MRTPYQLGAQPNWLGIFLVVLIASGEGLLAASIQDHDDRAQEASAPVFEPAETPFFVWDFGVEISADAPAQSILAICPLPVNREEQTIEIIGQTSSAEVSSVKTKAEPDDVELMYIRIERLNAGQTARAVVRMKIRKQYTLPPRDTESLRFAEPVPSALKKYLKPSPYIEIRDKSVRAFAESIKVDEQISPWKQIESIYDQVRERIDYEFDPIIRTCPEAIAAGRGDCEELSSLFISVCRLRGIPARAVWIPNHTYPEFYLEDDHGNGYWFPCQLAGSRQFGQMIEDRPILQKGDNFKMPGSSEPTRYLTPTLSAKNASGNLQLHWINEPVAAESRSDDR